MSARAPSGACLERLVRMAGPLVRAAQRQCPRGEPGRPHDYQDWQIACLILVAVLHRRKSKSAHYRFLLQHRAALQQWLDLADFPARSTYFARYRLAHRLFQQAISLQGLRAIAEGLADPTTVAVDKSLVAALGPPCHPRRRPPEGADRQAAWCHNNHHGWVWGYSFETVVCASAGGPVFPLLASAAVASASECRTFLDKAPLLPPQTRYVLADAGYDSHACQQAVEADARGRPNGRRFLCPLQARGGKPAVGRYPRRGQRARRVAQRQRRSDFLGSPRGRQLYRRRGQTVEPFHEWFKHAFELSDRVWHRRLDNNQTQLLAALFAYQLLLRYNHRCGRQNGQIQWILDVL